MASRSFGNPRRRSGTPVRMIPVFESTSLKVECWGVGRGLASLHLPAIQGGNRRCLSKYARMARLEKASMELKIPGMIAQGAFQPNLALIQKHRSQESGRARRPRFLAEIRIDLTPV